MMRTPIVLAVAVSLLAAGCGRHNPPAPAKSDIYLYADTRQLVDFVESAAQVIELRGIAAAVGEFARPESPWRASPTYLFVYDNAGNCVWHAMRPELIGQNLMSVRDPLGTPILQTFVDVARQPQRDASNWVFYMWEEQADFRPSWKASYIRKAVAPDGKVYLVGSGLNRFKMEKVFVQQQVDAAARLLQDRGTQAAFREFQDPASQFNYLGTFVFVLDEKGYSLVDPSYPTMQGRDMNRLRDAVGRPMVQELLQKLQSANAAWVQFLWPKPGERLPSRRVIYARKIQVEGQTFIVGSDFFLATPIWMKL